MFHVSIGSAATALLLLFATPASAMPAPMTTCVAKDQAAAIAESVPFDYPAFPPTDRELRVVNVRVELAATGDVLDTSVNKSSGLSQFDSTALRVAKANKYQPGKVGCRSVGGTYLLDVVFN